MALNPDFHALIAEARTVGKPVVQVKANRADLFSTVTVKNYSIEYDAESYLHEGTLNG